MKKPKSRRFLITSVAAAIACILQVIALLRYVRRLPDDWVGIVIYTVTMIAFALVAIGFFIRWKKGKQRESREQANERD